MILDLLITKKHQGPIKLWWGMRNQEDCFWIEDFDELEHEYPNFKWDLVLSNPPADWPLHSGHVTRHVLSYAQNMQQSTINNQQSACFYLCGNKAMIDEVSTKLTEIGINKEHIHTEKFF
jgi:Na+-transporting NADH:ubiquinone oxidoreductase subunit F